MELRELEWFVVLAETEHVTIAAAQLNISQPTLSRALSRLERRLGVRLFDRQQNRLRLNKYGEIFQAHAMRAMNEIAQANERITTLVDPERGLVSLGFLVSFGTWLVPELLAEYPGAVPEHILRTARQRCRHHRRRCAQGPHRRRIRRASSRRR